MNSLRKVLSFLMVLVLAAFAVPAIADGQDEKFSLKVVATTPGKFTATITNLVKDDDRIMSFKIVAPVGVTISDAIITSGTGSYSVATRVPVIFPPATGNVTFKNVNIKYNQYVVVTLTAALPNATSCGTTNYIWNANAWEGSSASGEQFALVSLLADRTTSVSNTCTMSFANQPANALTGAVIKTTAYGGSTNPATGAALQVQLSINGSPATGKSVLLTPTCSTGTLNLGGTNSATTPASGVASFDSLSSTNHGSGCTLKATATGFPDAFSSAFKVSDPSLAFVMQPNTTLGGALITSTPYNLPAGQFVSVKLLLDGVLTSSFDGTSVTIASSCVASGYTASVTGGVATFSLLKSIPVSGTTSCGLTASVPTITQFGSPPSDGFSITQAAGDLYCAGQGPSAFTDGTGTVKGDRGASNKDGSTCVPVVYNPTGLATGTDKVVNFKWDTASQPNAAFSYSITWNPTAVDPVTGMPPASRRTKVAWETDVYGVTGQVYVYGVACLSPNLPAPYTTLSSDNGTTLTANTTATVPAGPFDIVIGAERMTVGSVSGTTWNIAVRGVGGTTQVPHPGTAPLMSTPLPIDKNPLLPSTTVSTFGTGNPYYNKQARMCIWDEGFVSEKPGFVRFSTSVFDIGDGWVSYDE